MRKFFQGLYSYVELAWSPIKFWFDFHRREKQLQLSVAHWRNEAKMWETKYNNAKKYIEEIRDDVHSYE